MSSPSEFGYKFDIFNFILEQNIFSPNNTKSVTDIQARDIVFLGKQLCVVIEISKPYSTTLPLDFDKSTNPKVAIVITGQSIFWPKVKYESPFVYDHDNEIGTFSGVPKVYRGDLIDFQGNNLTIQEESGQTHLVKITDKREVEDTRDLYAQGRLVVIFAFFMGVYWVCEVEPHVHQRRHGRNTPRPDSPTEGRSDVSLKGGLPFRGSGI